VKTLKERTFRALIWDLSGSLSGQGISLVISIFLARLLEPAEFGLVGMALVFVTIFTVFSDFGLSSALVQNKDNSNLTYSSVFFLNIGLGVGLCIAFQLAAPLIATFFDYKEITPVVRWLSLGFVFSSFNAVQRTILKREIEFKTLAIRNLISQLISGTAGIIMAFKGFGVYSLVVQNLGAYVINSIILWKVSNWHPKWEFSFKEIRNLVGFSNYVFLSQVLNQTMLRLDVFVIGKLFSSATLGYFSRADSLNSIVRRYSSSTISSVFYPVLATLTNNRGKFSAVFLKLLHFISFFSLLLTGVMIFAGRDLILILFGPKWEPSVMIFQILALKAFTNPINSLIIVGYLALGKSKLNFWFGNVRKILSISTIAVAYFYGFQAFVISLIVVAYASSIFNYIISPKYLGLNHSELFASLIPYLMNFLISFAMTYVTYITIDQFSLLGFIQAVTFLLIYLFLSYIFKLSGFYFAKENIQFLWGRLKTL
jgi:O-antigen/teichoic acid export membrane protein